MQVVSGIFFLTLSANHKKVDEGFFYEYLLVSMKLSVQALMTRFLRNYREVFSSQDVTRMLNGIGMKITEAEVSDFLNSDQYVFPLEKKMYITRSGAFSGQFFSFVPTRQELDAGVFVPGDRCMPFVDPEVLSCSLGFEYNGRLLPKTTFQTDCNTARSLFSFFGDEYASQYIAADPVNKALDLASSNFELPSVVSLTAVSIKQIIKDLDFSFGDRFLCRVRNWDKGVLEIFPLVTHRMNPFEMNAEDVEHGQWCQQLEKELLKSFDRMGPCTSMEEQFANVFYEHRRELCRSDCASIHEFLESAKKVGMELFGVETRLWKKGQDVPAVGEWNRHCYDSGTDKGLPLYDLPEYIIDCYIQDQLYEKKDDMSGLLKKMLPQSMPVSEDERKYFTLQIMRRNAILKKKYNWFADFSVGSLRHRALELYSQVGDLVYEVDCASNALEEMPQQELVTLSQLFTHISRILEMIACDSESLPKDADAMQLSLEGMEYNFEDIRGQLMAAVERARAKGFEVI